MVQGTSGSMATSSETLPYHLPMVILRGVQWVFSIIILGLTAYSVDYFRTKVICDYNYYTGEGRTGCSIPTVNYMLFASLWTFLITTVYLISIFVRNIYNTIGSIILDSLSTVIWFASFISLAVNLGGTDSGFKVIQALDAADVFAALTWATFVAALVLTILRHQALRKASYNSTPMAPMQQHPVATQPTYAAEPTMAQHV